MHSFMYVLSYTKSTDDRNVSYIVLQPNVYLVGLEIELHDSILQHLTIGIVPGFDVACGYAYRQHAARRKD